jgi:hypothetical protein
VRVERIVLEDHRHVPPAGVDVVDDRVADANLSLADLLEAGNHPQRGRLPAAGRADQDHELAVGNLEAQVTDRTHSVVEDLRDVLERHRCHRAHGA